jgi:hypothetical protein
VVPVGFCSGVGSGSVLMPPRLARIGAPVAGDDPAARSRRGGAGRRYLLGHDVEELSVTAVIFR